MVLLNLTIERSLPIERGVTLLPPILTALHRGQESKFLRLVEEAKATAAKLPQGSVLIQVYLEVLVVVFYAKKSQIRAALERADAILEQHSSGEQIWVAFDWSSLWTLSIVLIALTSYLPRVSLDIGMDSRLCRHTGEYYRHRLAELAEQLPLRATYDFGETALRCFVLALLCHRAEAAQRIALRQARAFHEAVGGDHFSRKDSGATLAAFLLLRQALACFIPCYLLQTSDSIENSISQIKRAAYEQEASRLETRIHVQAQLSEQLGRRSLQLLSARLGSNQEAPAPAAASETEAALLGHRDAVELIWRIMDAQGHLASMAPLLDECSNDPEALYLRRIFVEPMERRRLSADAHYAAWRSMEAARTSEYIERASQVAAQYLALVESESSASGACSSRTLETIDWTVWLRLVELLRVDLGAQPGSQLFELRQRFETLLERRFDRKGWLARLAYQSRCSNVTTTLLLQAFQCLGEHSCGALDLVPWILALDAGHTKAQDTSALAACIGAFRASYPGPSKAQLPVWSSTQWRLFLNRLWLDVWSNEFSSMSEDRAASRSSSNEHISDLEPRKLLRWSQHCRAALSESDDIEHSISNGFLLLAAIVLVRLLPSIEGLDKALVMLRYGLRQNPHDHVLRIASIGLWNALDGPASAMKEWNHLRCKYVQHDSLVFLLGEGVDMIPAMYFAFLGNDSERRARYEAERVHSAAQIEAQESLQIENVVESAQALVDAVRSNHLDTSLHLWELYDRIERSVWLWGTNTHADLGHWLNSIVARSLSKTETFGFTNGVSAQACVQKPSPMSASDSAPSVASALNRLELDEHKGTSCSPTLASWFRIGDLVDNSDWAVIRLLVRPYFGAVDDTGDLSNRFCLAPWCLPSSPHRVPRVRVLWTGLWTILAASASARGPDRITLQACYRELICSTSASLNEQDDPRDWYVAHLADRLHPFDFGYRHDALARETRRLQAVVMRTLFGVEAAGSDQLGTNWMSSITTESQRITDRWLFCELRYVLVLALARRSWKRLGGTDGSVDENAFPSEMELLRLADWLLRKATEMAPLSEVTPSTPAEKQNEKNAIHLREVQGQNQVDEMQLDDIANSLSDAAGVESIWRALLDEKQHNRVLNRALFALIHSWIRVLVERNPDQDNDE